MGGGGDGQYDDHMRRCFSNLFQFSGLVQKYLKQVKDRSRKADNHHPSSIKRPEKANPNSGRTLRLTYEGPVPDTGVGTADIADRDGMRVAHIQIEGHVNVIMNCLHMVVTERFVSIMSDEQVVRII